MASLESEESVTDENPSAIPLSMGLDEVIMLLSLFS